MNPKMGAAAKPSDSARGPGRGLDDKHQPGIEPVSQLSQPQPAFLTPHYAIVEYYVTPLDGPNTLVLLIGKRLHVTPPDTESRPCTFHC